MRVLAVDTALEACSCAILDTERSPALVARKSEAMTRGHAEALVPMVSAMMEESGTDFSGIDRFAVTVGPGSFTGLRVGIAAARGFALAAQKPLVGLSTLSALAAPHIAENDAASTLVAIDARHDRVYLQLFAAAGRTAIAPCLVPIRDAIAAAQDGLVRIVGSAAAAVAAGCAEPPLLVDDSRAPDIAWVARLGAASSADMPAKPLYLRAPDAQPQTAAQLPRR
jgi:tRNA threonylcarbamoyl adenosine modification protein YeaZ